MALPYQRLPSLTALFMASQTSVCLLSAPDGRDAFPIRGAEIFRTCWEFYSLHGHSMLKVESKKSEEKEQMGTSRVVVVMGQLPGLDVITLSFDTR